MNEPEDSEIIINKLDGLFFEESEKLDVDDDFTKSLIITGVPDIVFEDDSAKVSFFFFD